VVPHTQANVDVHVEGSVRGFEHEVSKNGLTVIVDKVVMLDDRLTIPVSPRRVSAQQLYLEVGIWVYTQTPSIGVRRVYDQQLFLGD
jgi:hypothetical protein